MVVAGFGWYQSYLPVISIEAEALFGCCCNPSLQSIRVRIDSLRRISLVTSSSSFATWQGRKHSMIDEFYPHFPHLLVPSVKFRESNLRSARLSFALLSWKLDCGRVLPGRDPGGTAPSVTTLSCPVLWNWQIVLGWWPVNFHSLCQDSYERALLTKREKKDQNEKER